MNFILNFTLLIWGSDIILEPYVLILFLPLFVTYSEPEFKIAVALSDYSCVVYSVGEFLNQTITLDHNQAPIVGIKFSSTSKNILYIANNNGIITACDLRAKGKVVSEFKGNCSNNIVNVHGKDSNYIST